jgi:hypothetical protein
MTRARALLISALAAWPCAAGADLPLLIALDDRTGAELRRMLERVGYPEPGYDYVMSALVGVLWRERPTQVRRYYTGEGVPFVSGRSRRSGRCQLAELTAWFPDGSRPPIRLTGRYCRSPDQRGVLFEARTQRIRILPDDETPPSPPPGTGAEPE